MNVTIIAKNAASQISLYPSNATVKVIPNKTAIAIFPNAAVGGSTQTNRIKIPFSWGDATPKSITILQGLVKRASIVIVTPFNIPSSQLSLGDDLNSDRLISRFVNNPQIIAEFETSPIVQYASPTEIKLSILLGAGNNQGSGFVILEV
jgi:hypothetical protein